MISEQMIREKVSTKLKQSGWDLDYSSPYCNVTQEEKNTDYILKDQNLNPLLVLEVKKNKSFNIEKTFQQAETYAKKIKAPIIGITNGTKYYYKHLKTNSPLFYNGIEIKDTILSPQLLKQFINSASWIEIKNPQTRSFILQIYKKVNDLLAKIHVFKGIPRLKQFCNFLFLKLFYDSLKNTSKKEMNNSIFNWNFLIEKNNNNDEDLILFYKRTLKELKKKYSNETNLFEEPIFNDNKKDHLIILKKIINEIDKINFFASDNNDLHGEAFEFFLEINSGIKQSDLGQYFTPTADY